MHRARARTKNRELSVPAIRPEVMHVYSLEQTLSNTSDTASKALSRKRRMERVRSLSNEYRAEALADVHVIPFVYEAMFKALFKELVDSYVTQSARQERKKKSPGKTLADKSEFRATKQLKGGRNASTKALYVSKQFEMPRSKAQITEIEKNPLAAQAAVERQLDSRDFMLSSYTALHPERPSKGRSNSPEKRSAFDRRKEAYDSRN